MSEAQAHISILLFIVYWLPFYSISIIVSIETLTQSKLVYKQRNDIHILQHNILMIILTIFNALMMIYSTPSFD